MLIGIIPKGIERREGEKNIIFIYNYAQGQNKVIKLLSILLLINKLGNNSLILFIILSGLNTLVYSYILINSGGSAINFMNINFAAIYYFPI